MKTWQQYLTNQLSKFIAGVLALSLSPSFAQTGFYSNFKTLIEIQDKNYTKKLERFAGNSKIKSLSDLDSVDLDPDFVGSILFHTPARYSSLGTIDSCSLYDLILSGLAKGPQGEIEHFIVRYKNKDNQLETTVVNRKDFFEEIAFKKCPNVQKFQQYFNLKNVAKTLNTINLKTPTSEQACLETHKSYLEDHKTPYLCFLSEQVKSIKELERKIRNTPKSDYREIQSLKRKLRVAKKYKSSLSSGGIEYLDSLCLNLDKPKLFCDGFFKVNFLEKAAQNKALTPYLKSSCQSIMGRNELNQNDYKKCAVKMSKQPDLCLFAGEHEGVLAPRPDCLTIGLNLNHTKLRANYVDCPARVANDGIINLTRLINHFSPSALPEASSCQASSSAVFSQFIQNTSDGRFWNAKLCYDDKIKGSEVCHPVVYGDVKGSDLSLPKVVEKILQRTKGLGNDQQCRFVSKNSYRPNLLEFKSGCQVVVDIENCYSTSCSYEIMLDQIKINHIRQISDVKFDYFPSSFSTENFAQSRLIEKNFKLNSKSILNVSFLKSSFVKYPKGIIHGVACAEDMLPEFFSKTNINQCTPLPFIVDGYKEEDGSYAVIIRTARDSLHAPRLVPWSHLFSALKDYQRLHPLNIWGLNVLH